MRGIGGGGGDFQEKAIVPRSSDQGTADQAHQIDGVQGKGLQRMEERAGLIGDGEDEGGGVGVGDGFGDGGVRSASRAKRVKLLGSSSTAETRIWAPYSRAANSLAMAATDGSPASMIWRTLPAVSSATVLLMTGWAAKKRSHWARATGCDWMRRMLSSDEPGQPMTQWLMRRTTSPIIVSEPW